MRVGMRRYEPKVKKAPVIPLSCAINRFWGFPIGLITLPVVIATASVIRSREGESLNRVASVRTRGVPIMARVSFIRSADSNPIPKRITSTS